MVQSCAAAGCTNRYSKDKSLNFFKFPGKGPLLYEWLRQIRRVDKDGKRIWKPTIHSKLCSEHFKPECYLNRNLPGSRTRLKPGSIPSEFNFPPHLEKDVGTKESPNELSESTAISNKTTKAKKSVSLDHNYTLKK